MSSAEAMVAIANAALSKMPCSHNPQILSSLIAEFSEMSSFGSEHFNLIAADPFYAQGGSRANPCRGLYKQETCEVP
jgi:hypothetical protein